MHLVPTLALVLAALPFALSAARGKLGFALGAKNANGSCKFTADYEADFDAIRRASGSTIVRGYSVDECNFAQQVLPAAKNKGFKVVLGVWPDVNESFEKDKRALQAYAAKYSDQVYAVTVGSETLYRGNFTGNQLLGKIREVKKLLPNTKVGTADSWNKYADGTADDVIKGGVDILLVNAFSYWQGQRIQNASATYIDDIMQAFGHIQSLSSATSPIELWNGETGWPTDGAGDFGAAQAGTANANQFYQTGICDLIAWGVDVFVFEALDEPWKPKSIGDNGQVADETHWGVMNADRSLKYPISC